MTNVYSRVGRSEGGKFFANDLVYTLSWSFKRDITEIWLPSSLEIPVPATLLYGDSGYSAVRPVLQRGKKLNLR